MDNEVILKKVIEKARKKEPDITVADKKWLLMHIKENLPYSKFLIDGFLLSKLFAKAFWGADSLPYRRDGLLPEFCKCWEYHLQQMVLAEDKLKYLEWFL